MLDDIYLNLLKFCNNASDLRRLIKNLKDLNHRSTCFTCYQKVDFSNYTLVLNKFESKLKELEIEENLIYEKNKQENIKNRQIFEKERIKEKKEIESFIEENIKTIKKSIRDFKANRKYIPEVPLEKRSIWNKSIEWIIENDYPNLDYRDFLFD